MKMFLKTALIDLKNLDIKYKSYINKNNNKNNIFFFIKFF